MWRTCGPLLLAALMTMPAAARAQAGAVQIVAIPRVAAPPVLDGRLDDWARTPQFVMADSDAWQPAAPQFAEYQGPGDISAEVRLAWDNQYLYVAIETRDDVLVRARSAADMFRDGSYHGDSVVLSLAAEGAAEANSIVVALLRNASLVWRAEPASRSGELKTVGRLIYAKADEGGGQRVTYEMSIPWSEFDGVRPIAGERVTFSASAFDDDGAGTKGCLEQTAVMELSSSTTVLAESEPEPAGRQAMAPTFPAPRTIRFDEKRFIIKNADTLLFAGAVDYTTLPRQRWAEVLALARAERMNAVAVTVPWSYHQPTRDQTDLTDLRDFLAAVAAAGLRAEVNVGPFAGEQWEAGGVPGWLFALPASERPKATAHWVRAVLALVRDQQLTSGGPVVAVLVRPLPESGGRTDAASLSNLSKAAREAGIKVPVLTANAPAAHDNSHFALANLLDSISFYTPPTFDEVARTVGELVRDENGPAVASGVPGRYATRAEARQSADTMKVALANGATAVTVSSFAAGLDSRRVLYPGGLPESIIGLAGPPTAGYGELRLIGRFADLFGPQLARAAAADDDVRADDREVHVAARLTEKTGFIFLWNDTGAPRQVRLTYHPPGTATVVNIPDAGAVALPPGSAKIIPLDAPVGRGALHYSTSEVADIRQVGDRTVLVVYGDRDTAGEIALRWPGQPLVVGALVRQRWDEKTSTFVMDYFHTAADQHVLVDDLQILILSRDRAADLACVGDERAALLSTGRWVPDGALSGDGLQAAVLTPVGDTRVSAVVPGQVTAVLVDAKPVPFDYAAPDRVLTFTIATEPRQSAPPKPVWARLIRREERAAPDVHADNVQFRVDGPMSDDSWHPAGHLGRVPEALGLTAGQFAHLRARVDPGGRTVLSVTGVVEPTLVLVNGRPVEFPDATADSREADILPLLLPGENVIELIVQLQPREPGVTGLRGSEKRLPMVALKGPAGEFVPETWEAAAGLAGEAAGWMAPKLPADGWTRARLGPRSQSTKPGGAAGIAWYRIPFSLPKPDVWEAPYRLQIKLAGSGELYLNGKPLAAAPQSGTYQIPLPASCLVAGGENMLVAALCDASGQAAVEEVTITADQDQTLRKRQVEIKF